jgi:ubiquinone/menaquinone biosynthesis C-methylase UbiE
VPRIAAALGEAYRVLRIGGRFLCLEFSAVDVPGLAALYDFYSFNANVGSRAALRPRNCNNPRTRENGQIRHWYCPNSEAPVLI